MLAQLINITENIMADLQGALRSVLEDQGHYLTGNLSDSITYEINEKESQIIARMFVAEYGIFVNAGVSAQNIPYGKNKGGGAKTSKYIQGLIEFWQERGLSGREAIGAAFATAKIHAREGMPSRASKAYSKTGERTGFVRIAIEEKIPLIQKKLSDKFAQTIELKFSENFENSTKIKISAS